MDSTVLLRRALRLNALFSGVCGGLALALSRRVGESVSLPPWVVATIGSVLVAYAACLLLLAGRDRVASAWSAGAVALDLGWVIGSAVFLAVHPVQDRLLVVVVGAIVLAFAGFQAVGHRRAQFHPSTVAASVGVERPPNQATHG